jgi:hypothetical protein
LAKDVLALPNQFFILSKARVDKYCLHPHPAISTRYTPPTSTSTHISLLQSLSFLFSYL